MATSLRPGAHYEAGELHGASLNIAREPAEPAKGDPSPASRTGLGKRGIPRRRGRPPRESIL